MTMNMKLREYREEGYNLGHEDGVVQSSHDKAVETAKNLFATSLTIEQIANVTGLSIEEIQKLK